MCGICGKIAFRADERLDLNSLLGMMSSMSHRGPDDNGKLSLGPVSLGHVRLSIIDLNTGKQPLSNENGTIWIVFNGEIYNYLDLRHELLGRGHIFSTNTDTEVIVHAYEEYGIHFLERLRGMFAFAIWDSNKRILLLARDRVGIKPLYYLQNSGGLSFASEIKAILQEPGIRKELNYASLDRFLTYFYLPGSDTLISGIQKLDPGHYLIVKTDGTITKQQYWNIRFTEASHLGMKEAEDHLLNLLKETLDLHLISDVPVGFLLSGGIDSTMLVGMTRELSDRKFYSFTVGFADAGVVDERFYARIAAKRFNTEHHEMTFTAKDFLSFLPSYVWHMEEPVCEPPAIALYYVSKLAKEYVKVLISGEGGDEAFAGYQTYRNLVWFERIKKLLGPAKGPVSKILSWPPIKRRLPDKIVNYLPKLTIPLDAYYYSRTSSPFTYFNEVFKQYYTPDFVQAINRAASSLPTDDFLRQSAGMCDLNRMLYVDTKSWLPDDLLIKADKVTMANSVELRVPLLDHKVLEFAASLPPSYKLRGIETKHILRNMFKKNIPAEILHRKKVGFPVPYNSWLRTELKQSVYDILLDGKTLSRGIFSRQGVTNLVDLFMKGAPLGPEVFSLLVLEIWQRTFLDHADSVGPWNL